MRLDPEVTERSPLERVLVHADYLDRLGRKSLAAELRVWPVVAAKLSLLVVAKEHPNDSEAEQEAMAGTLLAHALEHELAGVE